MAEKKEKIKEEAFYWIKQNKGLQCSTKSHYNSPRISSEIADCSMPLTFDSYSFCSLGCIYCFAYFFKAQNPSLQKKIDLKSVNVDHLIKVIKGEGTSKIDKIMYESFYKKKFLLHWGGLADPFCNFEKVNKQGLKLIKFLAEYNYPTLFSFKGNAILQPEYMEIFEKYKSQKNFAFQFSIITGSDEMSKDIEIGVPVTSKRLEIMKTFSDMGYWTILRLRPFIIGLSDIYLDDLLENAKKAGMQAISTEFLALDTRCVKGMEQRYDWIAELTGLSEIGIKKYFKELSPKNRGSYMRLNRKVKERFIKKMYTFCLDNNILFACSDPDFKELNMSGSCCGMPDYYPDNKLLENWTRSQLTFHLKEARILYHKTGEKKKFYFNEVYNSEGNDYLDEKKFGNEHVGTIGISTAEVSNMTQKIILQKQWNNLGSPANPRNYLDGKIIPLNECDEFNNLIYEYFPLEYEQRWKDEGIILDRR